MGLPQPVNAFRFEDYLAWEQSQPEKHEYVQGETFAMTGARRVHVIVSLNLASLFRSRLAAGADPLVFEDGGQRRDFVHVTDVARANVLALTSDSPWDGPLNVASGRPVTLLEMAGMLALADGRGRRPRVTGSYRLGDVRHVTADPTEAARRISRSLSRMAWSISALTAMISWSSPSCSSVSSFCSPA